MELEELILDKISNEPVSWDELVSEINKEFVIPNGRDVRGILQGFLKVGWIVRTSNIYKEEYVKMLRNHSNNGGQDLAGDSGQDHRNGI